jgi:hypothetical protein
MKNPLVARVRGGKDKSEAKRWIKKRARELNAEQEPVVRFEPCIGLFP